MGCLMEKLNRIPRSFGSRIKQDIMGYTLSVDWKLVSPIVLCELSAETLYEAIFEAVLFFQEIYIVNYKLYITECQH